MEHITFSVPHGETQVRTGVHRRGPRSSHQLTGEQRLEAVLKPKCKSTEYERPCQWLPTGREEVGVRPGTKKLHSALIRGALGVSASRERWFCVETLSSAPSVVTMFAVVGAGHALSHFEQYEVIRHVKGMDVLRG